MSYFAPYIDETGLHIRNRGRTEERDVMAEQVPQFRPRCPVGLFMRGTRLAGMEVVFEWIRR